jgi:hypothetical protein
MRSPVAVFALILLAGSLLIGLAGCDGAGAVNDRNADIPADPGTAPPPPATGALSPSLTLGQIDPDNPDRIPLVVGGVSIPSTGAGAPAAVVEYSNDNLTVVVDGVVQGKRIARGADGLKADIAFVIDNTSSMGNEIMGVRSSVLSFLSALDASGADLTAGLVAFGDEMPDGFEPRVAEADLRARAAVYGFVDLSADVSASGQLYRFVEALPPVDPGTNTDLPELALAGVDFARRSFSWRPDAQRIYILITDDRAWGRGFASPNRKGIDAAYYTAESLGISLRDEGAVVHVYSPRYTPGSVSPPAYDVRALAARTGGVWNELDRRGAIDLTALGIIETTLATSLVEFVRDDAQRRERSVRAHVRVEYEGATYDGERTLTFTF